MIMSSESVQVYNILKTLSLFMLVVTELFLFCYLLDKINTKVNIEYIELKTKSAFL